MLMKARLTKLFTLLAVLIFGIGNVWGTEIFSWTVSSALAKNASEDATGGTVTCTGSAMGSETPSSSGYFKFNSSTQLTFTLSSGTFSAGDVISFTFTSGGNNKTVGVEIQETSPVTQLTETITTKGDAATKTYTVAASDGIQGQNKFSIKRVDSNFSFKSVSVTRGGGGSTDPVSSVTVAGATTGYATVPVALTATPDETATGYKWFVDGVEQDGKTSATFNFEAATPGTYSIVAKARNDYNVTDEWIASSAHTVTISKLCGELVKIVLTGNKDGNVSGILTGTKDVSTSTTTSTYETHTGYKLGSNGQYVGITGLSKPLRAGDVATVFVTTASAKLQLFSDKGTTLIGELASGVVQGENEIVLNSSATGKTAIYLYRTSATGSDMNPYVYSLSVNRSCTESDDCSISDVTINSEAITPVGKVYSYEVAAASALTEVAVTYSIHPLATAVPASGFTVAVPTAGDPANTQTITVTAEDGTHSDTYTISVSKATAASDVVTLDALAVTGYTLSPTFDAATLAYTITKDYGTADPTTDKVTYTKSEDAQKVEVNYDGTNHKFVVTVTAEDNTTTQDYEITINEAEAKRGLLTVPFSNGAKGAINAGTKEIRVPYIGASEPTVVLANIEYQSGVSGANASMEAGKLRITGEDSNYDDYTLTFVQLTPSALTLDELVTFDAVPSYAFAPYGWDSGKGVKFAKKVEDGTPRISSGNTRVYFAIQACDEVQLTSGSGGARDVKIYVNGVLSSVTKTAASGSAIKLALDNSQANFIAIESNQTGGDGGFTKILVKTLAANTLAYDDGAYTTGDAALDLSTLISTFNSDGAITYAVKTDNGTNASIDGNNFTATAVGTAVITATQVASETIRQASVDFNVVVTAGATKYTVTFDAQGGSAVDPQEVTEGGSPVEPTAPTKDEYIFKGWAESAGASVSDVVDVTSFTINAPKIFYAVWEAEPAGIKLVNGDGSINTTNFTTGATAGTVNFGGEDHNCAVFGSTGGSIVGLTGLNKVVAYNATTTQTKVKFVLYNTNSSAKELYLQKVLEGATEAVTETIAVPSKERFETVYYTYNSSDLRSFYVTVNSTNIRILQMKVIEDGTILKRAGEAGYELNLNKGRVFGAQGVETAFEGLIVTPSSNAKVLNSTELPITTPLSFSIAEPLTLKVTTSAAKYYVSQNSAEDGTTATAITAAGEETFDLTVAGTWYIVPSTTSAVKLTNIAFSAPRVDRTITFDSNGGSSVADIVVKDGEVATAPTDPTKDDNDFAGWYNGSDLYDWTAPVTSDLNLTAHWTAHVNNDATLKSLSYGSTAITLEDGVLTYNVNLPALTLAVPALTAEPNAALATADVTDAADFDGDGKATSSVLVTAEDGTTQLTYTVNFTKAALLPQVNVTANTIWDWANIASENITLVGGLKNYECVLANVEGVTNDATFNSQALLFCGERVRSVESSRTFASIGHISFNVTVPGKVTVEFSDNGTNNRRIKINDEQSDASSSKTDVKTFEANVAAGTVTIMGISNDGSSTNQYVRISRIEFEVASAPTPETVRTGLEVGRYYTICLPKKVVAATGATFWSMSERNTDTENPLAYIVEENLPLTAGQPFLFQATATTLEVTYEGEATTAGSHGALHGTLDAMDQDALDAAAGANTLYILKNNELRLASGRTGNSLAANRAYIIYEELDPVSTPSHAPGRQVRSMPLHKDVATGLDDLNADTQAQKVILNGQLFIIRGEKMYDATGILVK